MGAQKGYWPKRDWSLYDHLYSEEELALPAGKWVRKGLTKVFISEEPIPRKGTETDSAECGNNAGYRAHLEAKEPTCDACRIAHRDYNRAHRQRRAEQLQEEKSAA